MAVAHVWTSRTLDAEELADLYEWLDRVPLSKPRSNVEKDFADGILAAEIVRFYYPDIVDFRFLRSTLNIKERQEQWRLLNTEVFEKIGLTVPSHIVTQLGIAKTGIAQSFLYNLRMSLAMTGAQVQLFPPPQFLFDPRLNGASYPVHSSAQTYLYNPLWAAAFAKGNGTQLPYLFPPGFANAAEYEMFLKKGGAPVAGAAGKGNSAPNGSLNGKPNGSLTKLDSPSLKSFASTNGGDKTNRGGKQNSGFPPVVGAPPTVAVNSSISLNQTKSELFDKTKKLEDKEAEVNELKAQLKRMDEMIKSKNSKIQELTMQVEKLTNRPKESPKPKP